MLLTNVKLEMGEKSYAQRTWKLSIEERNPLQELYFNGRKDNTLVIENVSQTHFRITIQEEHYSITQEPAFVYVGQAKLSSSSHKNIANSIISQFTDCGFSREEIDIFMIWRYRY